ncbi:MAG: lysophospholipase [Chloroflexi bacterium]|nr:lysophospholipase [Chloroflexota bacterium]
MDMFEWTFKSSDGLDLYVRGWAPKGKPKAMVALIHGLGEHVGRYAHVGAALTEKGYALLGFDLRGHGKSGGSRGYLPSFEAFMTDIDRFLEETAERYPGLPQFLYGHSLGGILVLNYALRRKPRLAGVISTAAGLRTALEEQKVKVIMARILGTLMPTMTLASGLDPKTLSRDPAVVQAYISDPLVHDRMTLGFGKIMLTAIPWTFEHAGELQLPLLIMHGTKDMLGYPRGSQEFAGLAPKERVTLKMWDGFYHEIHNEPEKAEVFKVMLDWLDKH